MSIRFYPVSNPVEGGYSVKVNGRTVNTDTARVSAMPYNRRWPGHQRSLDQTEVIQFLSMEADEPLNFEITSGTGEKGGFAPIFLGITPELSPTARFAFFAPSGLLHA